MRPGSCLPGGDDEIPEFSVSGYGQDGVKFRLGKDLFSPPLRGLLKVSDWGALDTALLDRPVHGSLNGPTSTLSVARIEGPLQVDKPIHSNILAAS